MNTALVPVDNDPFDDDERIVADLAARGLTADEIAVRIGWTADAVRSHAAYANAPLTPACDARVERALYERAVGTVTWNEILSSLGERVRLERRLDADINAARTYLQARKPALYREMIVNNAAADFAALFAEAMRRAVSSSSNAGSRGPIH